MLTQSDIQEYRDRCSSPGKFEGGNPATVYYWECTMNGDGEYHDDGTQTFKISREESEVFILPEGKTYGIWESDAGFVYGGLVSD